MLGNSLEYYDLYLYIHMAVILNQKFFPLLPQDHFVLKNLGLINIYLLVPIAAIAWAFMGDLRGRRKVLICSSSVASVTTFLVCFLPEYNALPEGWGAWTMVAFLILRLIQGLAMAGEPYASLLYMIEASGKNIVKMKVECLSLKKISNLNNLLKEKALNGCFGSVLVVELDLF